MCLGGNGYQSSITQTASYYGAGGGGQGNIDFTFGDGLGFNNYGSGGHAGNNDADNGGAWKNGCVIIKFSYVSFNLPTTNLYAQYSASGPFTSTQWNDISGNSRHITTYRGTPIKTTFTQGTKGLTGSSSIDIISGTFNDGYQDGYN